MVARLGVGGTGEYRYVVVAICSRELEAAKLIITVI